MECVFTKKYEKVDSFLKRFLSHSRYTGVRLIEPCVAVSDVYNKQFKFVVLANEWLYVTENPPKAAKDIREVTRIVDITSVELINDVPEFLGGDLKYRTHHILVTYKKVSGSDFTAQLTPNSSPILLNKSLQENDFRNSGFSSVSFNEEGHGGQNTSSGTSRKLNNNLSKSLQENDLKDSRRKFSSFKKGSSSSPSDTYRGGKSNLSKSLQEHELKHSRRKTSACQDSSFSQDNLKHSMSPILPSRKSRVKKNSRNLLSEDNLYENDCSLANSTSFEPNQVQKMRQLPIAGTLQENSLSLHHSFSTIDDFRTKNSPTRLTVSASEADLRAMQVKFDPALNSGLEPNLTSTQKSGLLSWFKERQGSKAKNAGEEKSSGQSSSDLDDSLVEEGSSEIHFYMILDDTVMLPYLRSTWDNCLLNSAVKFAKEGRSPKTAVKNKPNSSQVIALFDQMEKEILISEDFQTMFELVHELLTACRKDVLVKRLFWQSPDLFVFLIEKINDYIAENPDEPMKINRADELEFVLLIIECLTEMFRETELLASRMNRLKSKKFSVVRDLILASITSPELSKTSSVIETHDISEAAEVLLTGKYRKKKNKKEKSSHDIELENISIELVKHQTALLHELFIVAYQAVWFPSDDKTFNVSWMVKIVESSTTTKRFLQVFVQQVMEIITKTEENFLTSDDSTLLYRLLSVLKTLLQQSSKLRQHVHDYYTEEFRYYVKPLTISNSLAEDCPLTPSTLKLVDDVIGLVTDVPLKNRRPPR